MKGLYWFKTYAIFSFFVAILLPGFVSAKTFIDPRKESDNRVLRSAIVKVSAHTRASTPKLLSFNIPSIDLNAAAIAINPYLEGSYSKIVDLGATVLLPLYYKPVPENSVATKAVFSNGSKINNAKSVIIKDPAVTRATTTTGAVKNNQIVNDNLYLSTFVQGLMNRVVALEKNDRIKPVVNYVYNTTQVVQPSQSFFNGIADSVGKANTDVTQQLENKIANVQNIVNSIISGSVNVLATSTNVFDTIQATSTIGTSTFAGNISASGNIIANTFYGDGSRLTGITVGSVFSTTTTRSVFGAGSNLIYDIPNGIFSLASSTVRSMISSIATGLVYDNSTGVITLASGYIIPTTASTTEWGNTTALANTLTASTTNLSDFFSTPSTRITAGTGLTWSGNTLNSTGVTSIGGLTGPVATSSLGIISFSTTTTRELFSANAGLSYNSSTGIFTIATSTLTTADIAEGSNLYFTNLRADARADFRIASASSTIRNMLSSTVNGIAYDNSTGISSLVPGYNIPLTASTTEWASKLSSQWSTNGSNISYSAGNVGIGTTTPGYALTVTGDANVTGALRFGGSAGTVGQVLQSTGSGAQWVATSTLGFGSSPWIVSGSNLYYSNGSISVGTGNSYTGSRVTSLAGTAGSPISGSNDAYRIQTSSYNDGGRATIVWGQDQAGFDLGRFGVEWTSGTSQMNFVWRDLYNSGQTNVELMKLTGAGNLGIGSSTPAAKLGVSGDAYILGTTTVGVLLSGDGSTTGPGLSFRSDTDTGIYRRASNQMAFSFGGTTKGTWDSTGLRIGDSTAPSGYAFQVIGDSAFNGSFSVTASMAMLTGGTVFQSGGTNYLGGTTYFRMSSAPFTSKAEINGSTGAGYLSRSLGVGTTTPSATLAVTGIAGSTDIFTLASSTNSQVFTVTSSGSVGIGTTVPTAQLTTTGTVQFSNFGAGTLQTDASGNLTVSSDERFKDIAGNFTTGLSALENVTPIQYHWKTTTGYDTETLYTGFSAQNIQFAIPEAVGIDKKGYLTLQDRPILAVVVNAIKELKLQMDVLRDSFKNILAWFGSNGDRLNVQGMVCVDDTCVTKEQFKMMLIKSTDTSYYPTNNITNLGDSSNNSITFSTTTSESTELITSTSTSATSDIVAPISNQTNTEPVIDVVSTTPEPVITTDTESVSEPANTSDSGPVSEI